MASATRPLPYKVIAGELCLDFVNTVSGRVPSGPGAGGHDWADRILVERLDDYGAFVMWGEASGALGGDEVGRLRARAGASVRGAAREAGRARALREGLYRIFKASVEGWTPPPEDVAAFNAEAARLRAGELLVWHEGRMERGWQGADELSLPLWRVVRSAVDLLTGDALTRVGQCPGERCGWLFLDTSRSVRRRWCTMADCGNLAKVRRFRRCAT